MGNAASAADFFDNPREIEAVGDLFANIWQVCYVTPDLDQGMKLLGDRLGIENFTELPTDGMTVMKNGDPVDWKARIAMGAKGGPIVELIQPVEGEVDFYRRSLPEDGSDSVAFHHLAVLVPLGDEPWEKTRDLLAAQGLDFEYTIIIPDRARLAYVDATPLLGHYLEICQLQPADTEFFTGLIEGSA